MGEAAERYDEFIGLIQARFGPDITQTYGPPATDADIAAVEALYEREIPEPLRDLWQFADGGPMFTLFNVMPTAGAAEGYSFQVEYVDSRIHSSMDPKSYIVISWGTAAYWNLMIKLDPPHRGGMFEFGGDVPLTDEPCFASLSEYYSFAIEAARQDLLVPTPPPHSKISFGDPRIPEVEYQRPLEAKHAYADRWGLRHEGIVMTGY